ncbi:probable WRKY transcription factor 53 [Juglans microcarpa x Juglans regia]|uniref:probable WRKY transcription factor 53 n=1 Tax=Juglans microcarpa x Juglans regia TaxID=2249226 RepID=UPI001B7E3979|nr:probable WRKY transcription factor 53 [Juglans microcarpa x Juglans regia]
MGDWEQKNLKKELTQGRELARQLQSHLNAPSSSQESREILVQKILASYEAALSMLRWSSSDQPQPLRGAIRTSESPPSDLVGSPRSEDSDRDLKNPEHRDIASRKRKALPTWTQHVRVSPGMGLDQGRLDDGFSWRKYGQKEILNATYPRGYYRCTHRSVQGCLATKQVQRSGEDPTMFAITYRGRHTCAQASNIILPSPPSPENQEPNHSMLDLQAHDRQPQQIQQLHGSQEMLLNFQASLKVETENLETHDGRSFPSLLDFPSASNIEAETRKYFPDSVLIDNNFVGSYSPSFMSPAISATNYFSVLTPSGMSMNSFGLVRHQHFQGCDQSELTHDQISSVATSATNSPTVGLDFPFGTPEFDANFTFDNPGFFS